MSELPLVRYLVQGLRGVGVEATHHEDRIIIGVPDISFAVSDINGWIECKYIKKWVIHTESIKLSHFTIAQQQWLINRPHCWLMLRVGDKGKSEHFLFNGLEAVRIFGEENIGQVSTDWGAWTWGPVINFEQLKSVIKHSKI